ncbi:MAG TPA: hypothetical protein VEC57_08205 [Candidatus Limnocylindrales bacterium]|nr:hypothetical protein [Candidatus Limnocylindrales bacterium]
MADAHSQQLLRALALLAGAALVGVSLYPLFDPPLSEPLPVLVAVPTLHERLFPGVPLWWVARRVLAMAGGAALIWWASRDRLREARQIDHGTEQAAAGDAQREAHATRDPLLGPLLVAGVALLAAAAAAPWLARPYQVLFASALIGVPALAVAADFALGRWRRARWASVPVGAVAVAMAWLALRLPASIGSYRMGDAVDYLSGYFCYEDLAEPVINLLTSGCRPGQSYMAGFPYGQGLLGWDTLDLSTAQTIAAVWTVAACLLVCSVIARRHGQGAALVGAAFFLWSPIVLVRPLAPGNFLAAAPIALALFFFDRLGRRPRAAAAASLATAIGLGINLWPALPPMLVVGALSLRPLLARRSVAIVAACFFLAASLPALPEHATWWQRLGDHTLSMTTMEAIWSGRVAPFLMPGARDLVLQDRTALLLGALLSPLAAPRASVGLWGDVFLEPVGTVLVLIGALVCAAAWRRSRSSRWLLALTLACLLAVLPGGYDRVHGARMELALPATLLAAIGWRHFSAALPRRTALAAAIALGFGMMLSGTTLFDRIGPRILPMTVPGLALRAGHVYGHEVAWSPGMTADALPPMRILAHFVSGRRVVGWNPAKIHRTLPEPEQAAAFWSLGDEMESRVATVLCQKPSGRSLYEVADASGRVRMFAAVRTDAEPPPVSRDVVWTRRDCSEPLPTDAVKARNDVLRARQMIESGQREQALAMLRETTQATVAQPRLYVPLAHLLADGDQAEQREAFAWAVLACRLTGGSYFDACALATDLSRRLGRNDPSFHAPAPSRGQANDEQ